LSDTRNPTTFRLALLPFYRKDCVTKVISKEEEEIKFVAFCEMVIVRLEGPDNLRPSEAGRKGCGKK
jgi:hypothetical protein